ncbi:MAG: hypothetical protein ICV73_06980 [Acetobacteraceae bacterium]|nr:hypothetical protein [Acetobacteraceae bacterium]
MGTDSPTGWEMEAIKRRLDRLASLLGPARAVVLLGLPAAADVEGQLRVEGLESFLAAKRIALHPGTAQDCARARSAAAIWLGDSPEELEALRRRPRAGCLLLWPRPEQAKETRALLADWSGPPPILCSADVEVEAAGRDGGTARVCALPDPSHALWGLLDHHPRGEGVLELPDGGWDGLLPPDRLAQLRRFGRQGCGLATGSVGSRLRRVARRRGLEAARRRVVAHAAVSGTRIGGSVLAALLGRGFRTAPPAGPEAAERIGAYWAGWRATVAVQ